MSLLGSNFELIPANAFCLWISTHTKDDYTFLCHKGSCVMSCYEKACVGDECNIFFSVLACPGVRVDFSLNQGRLNEENVKY